ncbi:MAG TPA: RNA 2',3'-cyclic phosphodiesterase [Polyangia bacterium]|jgi:2'-5' RNA ligase|nr:RNA 2',3'-cyclic phosphodiesterase [Polyangia bacterium]
MTTTTAEIRSFVAVSLPSVVQARILDAATSLAAALPAVRWSRKVENLHVTLKFLGDVAGDRLDQVGQALVQRLRAVPPFVIGLRGFGAFPSAGVASIIWAGIDDRQQSLAGVAALVEEVTAAFGFVPEERTFHGHITVGRTRERETVDARPALSPWADHVFGEVAVVEASVFESRLGREGSTYVLRCRVPLGSHAPVPGEHSARPH